MRIITNNDKSVSGSNIVTNEKLASSKKEVNKPSCHTMNPSPVFTLINRAKNNVHANICIRRDHPYLNPS